MSEILNKIKNSNDFKYFVNSLMESFKSTVKDCLPCLLIFALLFLLYSFFGNNKVSASSDTYLDSISGSQIILKNITTSDKTVIELDCSFNSHKAWSTVFSTAYWLDDRYNYFYNYLIQYNSSASSNDFSFFYGDGNAVSRDSVLIPGRHKYLIKEGSLFIDDVLSCSANSPVSFTSKHIILNHANTLSGFTFYGLKLYDDGVLNHNFLPYEQNGVIGLLDTCTDTFYAVDGAVGGSAVENPEIDFPLISLSGDTMPTTSFFVKTQSYPDDFVSKYEVRVKGQISDKFVSMYLDTDTNSFGTTIVKNGVYTFAYFDRLTGNQVVGAPVNTLTVTNIVDFSTDVELSGNVVVPILTAEYIGTSDGSEKYACVRTQYFTYEEMKSLKFYYFVKGVNSEELLDKINFWSVGVPVSENINGTDYYYFHFDIGSSTDIFCLFYDYNLNEFGYIKSMFVDLDVLYEESKPEDLPSLLELIINTLNFINPFSPNFFVYKLIELLLTALQNLFVFLFVPSDDFFGTTLNDMNSWLGDRLGILYYPIEVVVDFLTRLINICDNDTGTAVLYIPEFKFMDIVFIPEINYDFYSLLDNSTLKTVHNIYLLVVDAVFAVLLIILAKNTFVDMFGGRYVDDTVGAVITEQSGRYIDNKNHRPSGFDTSGGGIRRK